MGIIIQFDNVHFRPPKERVAPLAGVSLAVGEGELLAIHVRSSRKVVPLFDLAEGIASPSSGSIAFLGREWQHRSSTDALAARSMIGRVFEGPAWLSNLTVKENITLRQRHHTSRTDGEIAEEARSLASAFGLKKLPHQHSHSLSQRTLQISQWVRALAGRPSLVLLESPGEGVSSDDLEKLFHKVGDIVRSGGGVILTSRNRSTIDAGPELPGYRMILSDDGSLKQMENN
jgi:ABC-type lipoprotein export system ATPase subunit